ncbi:MAG: hypothetical protein ACE5JX_05910 [Acidobacteriota bacterium]
MTVFVLEVIERLPLDILHHDVGHPAVAPEIVDPADPLVEERLGVEDLLLELIGALRSFIRLGKRAEDLHSLTIVAPKDGPPALGQPNQESLEPGTSEAVKELQIVAYRLHRINDLREEKRAIPD